MPLHLLGKKSWNVYNQDNISKVRRDEAEAQAREEEQERRMQEVDADRRLQLLRGTQPELILPEHDRKVTRDDDHRIVEHQRKRRRIAGEDETDREMRYAREDAVAKSAHSSLPKRPGNDASITDQKGHISLFGMQDEHSGKNTEAEADLAKKKREYEDQYTMRFSNATGSKQGLESPWYATLSNGDSIQARSEARDWGNEDRGRREREKGRIDAKDPLATIKSGVKQLRDAEQHRRDWLEEREKDMKEVSVARPRNRRRRHLENISEKNSLEDFSLNAEKVKHDRKKRKHFRSKDAYGQSQRRDGPSSRDSRHAREDSTGGHQHHRSRHSS